MRPFLTAFFGACAITGAAKAQIYVDPRLGNDSNPATQCMPVRTITQAVTLLGTSPGQMIFLAAGEYSVASGEQFPITVPASAQALLMAGSSLEGAKITTPMGPQTPYPALQTFCDLVVLQNIDIKSQFTAVKSTFSGSASSGFIANNVDINAGLDGIHLIGTPATTIERTKISTSQICVHLESVPSGTSTPQVNVRSAYLESAFYGIFDATTHGGSAQLNCAGSIFRGLQRGYEKTGIGATDVQFENCTFYRNGFFTLIPASFDGAIVRGTSTGAIHVNNCLFAETFGSNDFIGYSPATDTVTNCIVTQASLVGLGGSFQAAVSFVDGPNGDLHLTAPSAAIDAGGTPAFAAADIDGYPFALDCASGAADIGADEYVHDFCYIASDLNLGSIAKVRMHADAGELFLAVWSLPMDSPPSTLCGAPYIPASYTFLTSTTSGSGAGVSTVGANGVGELLSPLPSSAALAGVTLWFQGVAVQVGGSMQISRNVYVGTFEP